MRAWWWERGGKLELNELRTSVSDGLNDFLMENTPG